jgi:hypothetical protein
VVATTIDQLAPSLHEDLLPEALDVARGIEDPGWRMAGLVSLAPFLPPATRGPVVQEAFELSGKLPLQDENPDTNYWRPLLRLANLLPEDHRSEVLRPALAAARSLDAPWRSAALIAVAEELESSDCDQVLEEALETANAFDLVQMTRAVQPSRRTDLLLTAVREAIHIQYGSAGGGRARLLADLAGDLAGLALESLHSLWRELFPSLAAHPREELAADSAALVPVIATLGGPSAVEKAARAVLQVERWWP